MLPRWQIRLTLFLMLVGLAVVLVMHLAQKLG